MLFLTQCAAIISKDTIQKPETLALRSNEILTAVIHGARKEEPSQDVQLAAIHALFNSLDFVRENFEREVGSFSQRGHNLVESIQSVVSG
jgi:importin subunit beta-1